MDAIIRWLVAPKGKISFAFVRICLYEAGRVDVRLLH